MDIAGKVAVVSGGASGIGKATVLALANHGARVVVVDLDDEGGQQTVEMVTARQGEATFHPCDVTRSDELTAAFDGAINHFGRLDIAFNNAGIGESDFFGDEEGAWKQVIAIDLTAVIDATRMAVTRMQRGGDGGVIINTASMIGLWPMPASPVYAAAKAGVVNFTRSLGYLTNESNIRVNTICPELVDTPLARPLGEDVLAEARRTGSIIKPEEVASAVIELIEDDTRSGSAMTNTARDGRAYVPLQP